MKICAENISDRETLSALAILLSVFSLGTEYAVFSALSLRMGYLAGSVPVGMGEGSGGHKASDEVSRLGAGLGMRISGYQIDYAFTPLGELGNTQRISLNARF